MDWFGFVGGIIVGGAIMYYIQPSVKDFVARAFGWEAKVAQAYRERAVALTTQTPPKSRDEQRAAIASEGK